MGILKDVNRDDLLNRFANHSFTETVTNDMTLVEFEHDDTIDSVTDSTGTARFNFASGPTLTVGQQVKNSSFVTNTAYNGTHTVSATDGTTYFEVSGISFGTNETGSMAALIARATAPFVDDAYLKVRRQMVEGGDILIGDFTFQGSTKFGGDTNVAPAGAIDIVGADLETARLRNIRYQAGANSAAVIQVGHSRGTEASPTALSSGDRLGSYIFVGYDGGGVGANGPAIRGYTTEAWGTTARGSKIEFDTVKNTETTQNVALTVSQNGFPVLPSHAVASLPTAEAGGIIYVSDETGGATLAFSDGTNWRRVQDRAIVA